MPRTLKARILQKYTPAICLCGVGSTLKDSVVSDSAHFGMLLTGNDHVIEGNHFHTLVQAGADVSNAVLNHWRWGHIRDLAATKQCTVGIHGSCKPQDNCPCCIQGAAASKKKERIKALLPSATVSLGQVSVDTHSPYPKKSLGGHVYVLVFVPEPAPPRGDLTLVGRVPFFQ